MRILSKRPETASSENAAKHFVGLPALIAQQPPIRHRWHTDDDHCLSPAEFMALAAVVARARLAWAKRQHDQRSEAAENAMAHAAQLMTGTARPRNYNQKIRNAGKRASADERQDQATRPLPARFKFDTSARQLLKIMGVAAYGASVKRLTDALVRLQQPIVLADDSELPALIKRCKETTSGLTITVDTEWLKKEDAVWFDLPLPSTPSALAFYLLAHAFDTRRRYSGRGMPKAKFLRLVGSTRWRGVKTARMSVNRHVKSRGFKYKLTITSADNVILEKVDLKTNVPIETPAEVAHDVFEEDDVDVGAMEDSQLENA